MLRILLILIIPLSAFAGIKDKTYGSVIVAEVTSIYDADTFRVNIQDYPPIVGEHMSIRVLGIDAPEIRGKCESEKKRARQAKQFTVQALRSAKIIELRNIKRGKYFRLLANVYVDGQNLAQQLINAGHARPYDGGKRAGWCNR
ncbi:MAG: thermonuclease family protein [Methylococcales bacterium]